MKELTQSKNSRYKKELAELIGTFILVFAGTGAIMVDQISEGATTHLGISLIFGAVVAIIYTFGHISDAHFNPAVTLAFWRSGCFPKAKVFPYIIAQTIGASLASVLLRLTFGPVANMGATLPLNNNWQQSFVLETVLTFILMMVILGSGLDRRAHVGFAGIAIGLTVGLEATLMGPITGASMNPARILCTGLSQRIVAAPLALLDRPDFGCANSRHYLSLSLRWVFRYSEKREIAKTTVNRPQILNNFKALC